jgi:hypothetical protein
MSQQRKLNDLSRSLIALDMDTTLIAVVASASRPPTCLCTSYSCATCAIAERSRATED